MNISFVVKPAFNFIGWSPSEEAGIYLFIIIFQESIIGSKTNG
jgi:hypothetical protein